uniref:Uncharacterized protein n=1 Tax=Ditylenchus dipsaci TaxID=166011 RepID=A0A915EMV4_9BILA
MSMAGFGYPSHIVVVEQKKKKDEKSSEKTKPQKKNIGSLDRVGSFDKLGKGSEKQQYSPASPNYAKNDNPKMKLAGNGDPDRARFKDSPYQMTQLVLDPTHVNVEDIETNSLRAIASES